MAERVSSCTYRSKGYMCDVVCFGCDGRGAWLGILYRGPSAIPSSSIKLLFSLLHREGHANVRETQTLYSKHE